MKIENMEADIIDLQNKLKACEKEQLNTVQYSFELLQRQSELRNRLDEYHDEKMTSEEYNQEKMHAHQR